MGEKKEIRDRGKPKGFLSFLFSPGGETGEELVKVCPKCGGKEITSRGYIQFGGLSADYVCKSCGYQASFFPEVTVEEAEKIPYKPVHYTPYQMSPFSPDYSKFSKQLVISVRLVVYFTIGLFVFLFSVIFWSELIG